MSFHLEICACPIEPNVMSRLCGERYCVSCVGQVSEDEKYECVILWASISVWIIVGCIVRCMFLDCMFFGFFKGYGNVSLYEPKYFSFKILGRGLEVLCGL